MSTKPRHTTSSHTIVEQLELPFDDPFGAGDNPAVWTPRDIWVRLTQRQMAHFGEDRRIEYKRIDRGTSFDDLATYYSAFSNTPDGGVIVFGADDHGNAIGCSQASADIINRVESFHVQMCPQAKPELKRIPVIVENVPNFCIAVFLPYIGKLVETNKNEAWIRYGDNRHKMSEEEKRDYRSTRQELSYEMEMAPYTFPDEFELRLVQDFCDNFRQREGRVDWSNEEVLVDRHLATRHEGKLRARNSLVLMAAKDPRKTIPGCRIRVQRFSEEVEGVGDKYALIKDRYIEGNIVEQVAQLPNVMKEFIQDVTWLNREGKFVTTPEYPRWAWFESIINACVHRSYSFSGTEITVKFFPNRMEVESPGGFVPPVNETTIYSTRAARNPHLMDAMRYLGYVQMAREGTRRIQQTMKDNGLPAPVFKQEALYGVVVRVTLFNDHETRKRSTDRDVAQFFGVDIWKTLQDHEIKLVAYAFRNTTIQVSEASRLSGRTWSTSKKDLERLTRKGLLTYVAGDYARDPKAHYVVTPAEKRDAIARQ